jgi:hypothetical protein
MKVYIGWDQRDIAADRVCKSTLLKHASIPVEIFNIKEFEMRARGLYWRPYHVCDGITGDYPNGQMVDDVDGKPFSTGFSFTRFLVPELEEFKDEWVLFMDADMMWRADIAELQAYTEEQKAIICVKHSYAPPETHKMDGVVQETYKRKNWSSFMLMNPARCKALDRNLVNTAKGSYLHGMFWIRSENFRSNGISSAVTTTRYRSTRRSCITPVAPRIWAGRTNPSRSNGNKLWRRPARYCEPCRSAVQVGPPGDVNG